ncbi:MAG: rhomboid family intramembrane serine protease [Thermoanaerobaculales bacterium]|jgi:membrane associated rhomboid family serine protease|nr:rhomboid family intramembrane serine protease [Thermoanaerobaculales bacterium]
MTDGYTTTTTDEPRAARRVGPMDRPLVAVPAIIALNIVVFLAWQAARFIPWLEHLMASSFLVSTSALLGGRVWSLLGAAFSHIDLWHIALNMLVLWSFGSVLERLWGTRRFVVFYLVASVVASLSHCLVSSLLIGDPTISALGASGAVSGLLLAFALLFPRHRILVFGIIPVPALVGALAFVGIDLWGLFAQTRGGGIGIGHGAHLGGALCGFAYWALYLRTRFKPAPPGGPAPLVMTPEEVERFQELRRKLDREGPQALTPKEKVFLDDIRDRVMRAHEGR